MPNRGVLEKKLEHLSGNSMREPFVHYYMDAERQWCRVEFHREQPFNESRRRVEKHPGMRGGVRGRALARLSY
jgi:hypothetical protein